jgi:hypothetical protein
MMSTCLQNAVLSEWLDPGMLTYEGHDTPTAPEHLLPEDPQPRGSRSYVGTHRSFPCRAPYVQLIDISRALCRNDSASRY